MNISTHINVTSTAISSTQDHTSDPDQAVIQLSREILLKSLDLLDLIRTRKLYDITFDGDVCCSLESQIEPGQFSEYDDSDCTLYHSYLRVCSAGELSIIYPYKYLSGKLRVVVGDLSELAKQAGIVRHSTCNDEKQQDSISQDIEANSIRDFMCELENSFESLTMLGETYGHRTMADLLYLQSAIANNSFIEHIEGDESNIFKVVQQLPSSKRWENFIHVNT